METSLSDPPRLQAAAAHDGAAPSTLRLVAGAPIALLVPSEIASVDRAKLALLGAVLATFFLFAAKTWYPGGADQFIRYADAIVSGTTLPADVASRDAGYPLLIILSGYPTLHSIVPLLLIQAGFAVLLPVLIYEGLRRLEPVMAFYAGLAGIVTLSPFYFMKMIHHDQTYLFFSLLMLCQLLIFVQTKQIRFLYFFTIAAICASVARPSGNALFPLFLIVAYVAARGHILHYVACAGVFAAFVAGYAWHRHVIFDMDHARETPSYLGEQIFYNPYLNALDYGIRFSPNEIGPNFSTAVANLRERLQPSPRESKFLQTQYVGDPDQTAFAEAYLDPLTTDELIEQVLTNPNWEYYTLLCIANDDRVLRSAALEIARADPGLILRYSVRNLMHFIFSPGYKHSRFNFQPFRTEGLFFYPAEGNVAGNIVPLSPQATREVVLDPVPHEPFIIHRLFSVMQTAWLKSYRFDVAVMAWLMCAAWIGAAACLVHIVRLRPNAAAVGLTMDSTLEFTEQLAASIVIASLVFGYNAAVTAVFAEPDFRYRQAVDLQAILIAGLGLISIQSWLKAMVGRRIAPGFTARWDRALRSIHANDAWRRLTAIQLGVILGGVVFAGFAGWTLFMVINTRA